MAIPCFSRHLLTLTVLQMYGFVLFYPAIKWGHSIVSRNREFFKWSKVWKGLRWSNVNLNESTSTISLRKMMVFAFLGHCVPLNRTVTSSSSILPLKTWAIILCFCLQINCLSIYFWNHYSTLRCKEQWKMMNYIIERSHSSASIGMVPGGWQLQALVL